MPPAPAKTAKNRPKPDYRRSLGRAGDETFSYQPHVRPCLPHKTLRAALVCAVRNLLRCSVLPGTAVWLTGALRRAMGAQCPKMACFGRSATVSKGVFAGIVATQGRKKKTVRAHPRPIRAIYAASKTANVFVWARYPIALSAVSGLGGPAGNGRCLVPPSRRRGPKSPRSEFGGNGAESRDDAPCRPPLIRRVRPGIENGGPIGST